MTIVLVHGVPETAALWAPLIAGLQAAGVQEDIECLSPPGFGAPVPPHFEATIEGYRRWLVAELERFDAPVHAVGHDWGGVHVVAVAMTRPALLRSWASDALGVLEPGYVWHDLVRTWQTAGAGEKQLADLLDGTNDDRAARMAAFGVDRSVAAAMAPQQDATMQRCILNLSRSAIQPAMADLGRALPRAAARPGLAILASEDRNGGDDRLRHSAAARAGAKVAPLEGRGHWWMTEEPELGARTLAEFWSGL
ncbi:MAG: alpha/beta hydrolase [Mycobacterium sp.]